MLNFKTHQLDNGLRLITAPLSTSEAVTILITVAIGGRYESADHSGISHFLEHLFFKGTPTRPSTLELSRELDSLGANYNAYTSDESTAFYIQCDSRDFGRALELISDLFLNPIFPEAELEKEKGVILEEANMRRDVPQLHVQIIHQAQMFPNSALGRDLIGTPETIKKISREDIKNYFKSGYAPEVTAIVIAGNQQKNDWQKEVEKIFGGLPAGARQDFTRYSAAKIEPVIQQVRKVDQTHFVLSAPTFAKVDPRRYALTLLATILGGSMSSRLFMEIREKRSLCYYIKCDLSPFVETGLLSISAGVKKDKVNEAIKVIFDQIEDLKAGGPTEEELERAKKIIRGHLALSLEGSFEIASYLAEEALYEDKIRQSEEIIDAVDKVKSAEIKALAQDVFKKDKMGLALIGPEEYKINF